MLLRTFVTLFLANAVFSQSCYWNEECGYQLFSSKTPYDTVRGDIRDHPLPQNCRAVSIWSLNRHGNRNPGGSVTERMRTVAGLRDEIVQSHQAGRGQLCAQDVENFKNWQWNVTLEESQSFLTGVGYEELYDIGRRLREKYPQLLEGSEDDYYFRTTNEQRTITSSMAFIHGWTEGTNHNLTVDGPWEKDDVIRPYENCDRYQQEVKGGATLEAHLQSYETSHEFLEVQRNVQSRLGLNTQLSADDVYTIYEICRFYRSWEIDHKSPWCATFSSNDLVVLEYKDDVKHFYRNGHGSMVNVNLGKVALKDLYQEFTGVVQGEGKKMVAYFTHDTMIEMVISAMELFLDPHGTVSGSKRDPNRIWRTSHIGCFSSNILAVLNSCDESGSQTYRVQIFFNEKVTDLCPSEGCTWEQFKDKFGPYSLANLDFCSMNVKENGLPNVPGSASMTSFVSWMLVVSIAAMFVR